ncbi:unnamed protein product [Lactuca virosa]|uniref:Uncharacterized protein n=1 Tax=Lactuca virosa TaxID=75947 RepID=A0AAU9NPD4_9ASTR|nr:unnamed protein product [Lactuca virosa]
MEQLFNTDVNKNLNKAQFKGPMRQIFVEFLERSCTTDFFGFLLYKEPGRQLKKRTQRWLRSFTSIICLLH